MTNIKIDNVPFTVDDNITILEACRKNKIDVPTLCFLKGINENASCRVCLVEVTGARNLLTSCSTKVTEGMEIFTENERVSKARKKSVELLLSNHDKDCDNCLRNGNCKLQELIKRFNIDEKKFKKKEENKKIDDSSVYLVRDRNKCVLCNRCVSVCKEIQDIAVIGKNKRGIDTHIGCAFEKDLKDSPCIACGQCTLVCPTGALTEKDDTDKVRELLNDKSLHVVAMTAPSVRVTLGEEFLNPVGTNVKGKMVSALRSLGFGKVFDVNFGADLTIMEEVNELINRVKENKNLPMFTSCSPGWIKYIETYHSDMLDHLSSCKSPQQMQGAIIKTYYAMKNNIDPKNIRVVSVMPCIAKKFERSRKYQQASGYDDVDVVITTRELARMIKKEKIDFNNLSDSEFDNPLKNGASVIFGSSGGVMEAALRTFVETVTNEELKSLDFKEVRGINGVKEASYMVNGMNVKVAVVSGIKNAMEMLKKVKNKEVDYHFIEFMTCPGGCINGGGQPLIDFTKYSFDDVKKLRTECLLNEDSSLENRRAHKNPDIIEAYKEYLGNPGSHKAEEILHTKYEKRNKYN